MKVTEKDLSNLLPVEGEDACARSGLRASPETAFSTLYTSNFERLLEFYTKVFGAGTVRFRGEGIAALDTGSSELVLQRVGPRSPFAPMIGKQSFGLVRSNSRELLESLREAGGRMPDDKSAGNEGPLAWDVAVSLAYDPDGNIIQLVEARE